MISLDEPSVPRARGREIDEAEFAEDLPDDQLAAADQPGQVHLQQ
jgi:hypothetical protein